MSENNIWFNLELTEDNEYLVQAIDFSAFGINSNPTLALRECISQLLDLRNELRGSKSKLGIDLGRQLVWLEEKQDLLDKLDAGYRAWSTTRRHSLDLRDWGCECGWLHIKVSPGFKCTCGRVFELEVEP